MSPFRLVGQSVQHYRFDGNTIQRRAQKCEMKRIEEK